MYYTYVLQSEKDNAFYVGFTKDLKLRLSSTQRGKLIRLKTEDLSGLSIMKLA